MGDLVQPGASVLGLLERLVVLVGLDERVLREVGRELWLAEHAQQVGVDLAVVLREEGLDESPGLVVVPGLAHRAHHWRGPAAEGIAKIGEGWTGDDGAS